MTSAKTSPLRSSSSPHLPHPPSPTFQRLYQYSTSVAAACHVPPAATNRVELQLFPKINYQHRTGTTRMRINTSIYHRLLLTTGNFTGIYIICTINPIYHSRHTTGNLEFYTTCTDYRRYEKIPACR